MSLFPFAEAGPVLAACNLMQNAKSGVLLGCECTFDGKLQVEAGPPHVEGSRCVQLLL